ncbi:hypothetical protein SBRCBS47491_007409 [Sporothrix bragantina]|uniref:N-acetyltransferase domain-containing protein n=1 Tax=Sporothrix bragantina TaxID=671064 RepID=A0ABP0CD02_9PEZI
MANEPFPTKPLVRLATCVLRPYHASDLEPMCAAANDPDIVRFMRDAFPSPYDREAGLTWLRICNVDGLPPSDTTEQSEGGKEESTERSEGGKEGGEMRGLKRSEALPLGTPAPSAPSPDVNLAICLLDGTFVGGTGLRAMSADGTDRYSREIGYWIGKAFWGRGLATEVAAGLGRWALSAESGILTKDGRPLRRVEAGVYAENLASARVLERAGYVREGVRRQAVVKNGVMQDVVVYGLIASDVEVKE